MFTCLFTSPVLRLTSRRITHNSRKFSSESEVLTKEVGNNALVILNRPKSLNAMTPSLHVELLKLLKSFEKRKSLVVLKGAGDRGFSAGGDLLKLKEAYDTKDVKYMKDMIFNVNNTIYLIHQYKIPTVALINGIVFGGGAGTSAFAKYRIATENTQFAMPETKIAFHPNSAATYFLNRAPGKLGYYLGLTANSLYGADVLHAGYATHYCRSNKFPELEEELLNSSNENEVKSILEHFCEKDIPKFSLASVLDRINKCFQEKTVESVFEKLRQDGSPWAKETLDILSGYSPTSLKVTLKQLQRGRDFDLKNCLAMESNLTINFYNYTDVIEGTRIRLVDRKGTPKWNPSKLSEVTEQLVEEHFQPVAEEEQRRLLKEIDLR